jgi:AraC-like DNA-binding protein
MRAIPLLRASMLRPILDYVERRGVALGPILTQARPLLRDTTALLPVVAAGELVAEAVRVSGSEAIGLRAGEATSVGDVGDWGLVLRQAVTVAGALEIIVASARRFNTGERFWITQRGNVIWLQRRMTSRLKQGREASNEYALMLILDAIRAAAGPHWRPDEIHMEGGPPPHAEEIAALARKRICFGQPQMALVFPVHTLACRYSSGAFPQRTAPHAPASVPASDFETSARQTVASLLRLGSAELRVAAEVAGMSDRSFQRRLSERGLRFLRLVEDARFDLARQMLLDPDRKIVEVSAALGYTDSANFTRAFRRWAGVPPQVFRQAG